MNWVDIAILFIVVLSGVISLMRGFVREALSLAVWILAFWLALTFGHKLAALQWMVDLVHSPTARLVTAFGSLFILTLVVGALVNYLVGQLVKKSGLSGTDRMVGMVFGLGRGIALVGVLVLLAGLTDLPKETWWRQSVLIGQFETLAGWMKDMLPADVQSNFKFH